MKLLYVVSDEIFYRLTKRSLSNRQRQVSCPFARFL